MTEKLSWGDILQKSLLLKQHGESIIYTFKTGDSAQCERLRKKQHIVYYCRRILYSEEFYIPYLKCLSISIILCTPLAQGLSSSQLFMSLISLPERGSCLFDEEVGDRDSK